MTRRMRTPREIYEKFIKTDKGTVIRKANIRTLLAQGDVHAIRVPNGWVADIDEIMRLFGAEKNLPRRKVPRIRNLEESITQIKRLFPQYKLTIAVITEIIHSGKIFVYYHGNRWILNFDELVHEVEEYIKENNHGINY